MSSLVTNSLTRRSLLRKGACCLALPFLESTALAASKAKVPKRLIFLGGGYGFTDSYRDVGESFFPKEAGRFPEMGLTKGLSPLERHQDDFTCISNLTNLGVKNPHGGSFGYLNCGSYRTHEAGLSCDQVAAKTIGKDNRFPSLVLTAREPIPGQGGGHGAGYSLSADARGKSIPGIPSPLELYRTLFAQKGDSPESVLGRIENRQSILDMVRMDGSSVRGRLAKEDQSKLDEYFTSVREIELGLQREAKWANRPKMEAAFEAPKEGMKGDEEIRLMLNMMILALQTDMTRVASYRFPVFSLISSLDITLSPHSLSHYGFSDERRSASEKRDRKLMELFSWFLDRLKETKDVEGRRLYDTCLVSYGGNLRSGHGLQSLPALLSGGAADRIKHGKHIVLPKENTSLANYWLTLLQQVGVELPQFAYSDGVVSELLG
ncbi:MAG: DUF1552 domain-containing protein [Akkermansiaceae bacterium]